MARLSSLRGMATRVRSQIDGPGCDLLLAENGSMSLLSGAKELLADVENYASSVAAAPKSIEHSVVRGECLWRIAGYADTYSDPFLWPLIYSANRDQIKDPDLIFPGQVFEIPLDVTEGDKGQARHEASTRGVWSLYDGR
ncbi:MAG: LysM peptidoglycan-binding domain-containing protein [Candidatus Coatesbacteria bacterium]|nr:LysM peptidoglycan-binding domain-containing protein [Candidatus Coatesbacteria bacterium]